MNKQELEKIKQKALEEHIPIIMDDTLEVIEKYLKENKPHKILEIGTAVGYSAICFTEILAEDGQIDTIERDTERVKEAKEHGFESVQLLSANNSFYEHMGFTTMEKYRQNWYELPSSEFDKFLERIEKKYGMKKE